MCGRYSQTQTIQRLAERFGFQVGGAGWAPRYNIAPTQNAMVVTADDRRNRPESMRWGLIPSWSEGPANAPLINARSESLSEKPSFRNLLDRRRCLVPADGFYEWRQESRKGNPYRIVVKGKDCFSFAGLWDVWVNAQGEQIKSFVIITTAANEALRTIHERMPAILRPEHESQWLTDGVKSGAGLLSAYPPEEIDYFEVSPFVNSAKNDGPECFQRVGTLF